jgi:hypothetical protein
MNDSKFAVKEKIKPYNPIIYFENVFNFVKDNPPVPLTQAFFTCVKGDYVAIIDALSQAYSNTLIYIQSSIFAILLLYHFFYNNFISDKQKVALTAKRRRVSIERIIYW